MKRMTVGLLAAALAISACVAGDGIALPEEDGSPLLQVRSEGGFAPIEFILGHGPRYTLLTDGRLISEGPVPAIYPGPLVPNYQVTTIDEDQMRSVLDLVEAIGLPDMIDTFDDVNTNTVADATTEIVTYWDAGGSHRYSVYALGLIDNPSVRPETASFQNLVNLLDQLASQGESTGYVADRVQYVAGPGFSDPDFAEVLGWPLDNEDFDSWAMLPNGWACLVLGGEVPGLFFEADNATLWTNPEGGDDLKLLVRPLLPGEEACFSG